MSRDAYQMCELVAWTCLVVGLSLVWVVVP